MGGFQSYFRPMQLRGISEFPFFALYSSLKIIFRIGDSDESHAVEHFHSERSPMACGFQSYFRPPQLRGVPNFHFRGLCDFEKLIFRTIAPCESHFGRKRSFRGKSDGVRISVRPPAAITRGFYFPFLRFPQCARIIYRIATSDESHFGQNGHS